MLFGCWFIFSWWNYYLLCLSFVCLNKCVYEGLLGREERYCQFLSLWIKADSPNSCLYLRLFEGGFSEMDLTAVRGVCSPLRSAFLWLTAGSGWVEKKLWGLRGTIKCFIEISVTLARCPLKACSSIDNCWKTPGKLPSIMPELVLILMQHFTQISNGCLQRFVRHTVRLNTT